MLNNTDSVLKKGEVEGAIQDYEALFAGARTEVLCSSPLPVVAHYSSVVVNGSGAWFKALKPPNGWYCCMLYNDLFFQRLVTGAARFFSKERCSPSTETAFDGVLQLSRRCMSRFV